MNRIEFLKLLGTGTLATCAGCSMLSCGSQSDFAPTNVDFTLDLTASANSALNTVGGVVKSNGVFVVRSSSTEYIALSGSCTHEGVSLDYLASSKIFNCSAHGSQFNTSGTVTKGPASKSLKQYTVEVVSTTSLRVHS